MKKFSSYIISQVLIVALFIISACATIELPLPMTYQTYKVIDLEEFKRALLGEDLTYLHVEVIGSPDQHIPGVQVQNLEDVPALGIQAGEYFYPTTVLTPDHVTSMTSLLDHEIKGGLASRFGINTDVNAKYKLLVIFKIWVPWEPGWLSLQPMVSICNTETKTLTNLTKEVFMACKKCLRRGYPYNLTKSSASEVAGAVSIPIIDAIAATIL